MEFTSALPKSPLLIFRVHIAAACGEESLHLAAGHLLAAHNHAQCKNGAKIPHDALLMGRAAKRSKQVHYRIILRVIRHAALTSERFQIPEC